MPEMTAAELARLPYPVRRFVEQRAAAAASADPCPLCLRGFTVTEWENRHVMSDPVTRARDWGDVNVHADCCVDCQ